MRAFIPRQRYRLDEGGLTFYYTPYQLIKLPQQLEKIMAKWRRDGQDILDHAEGLQQFVEDQKRRIEKAEEQAA